MTDAEKILEMIETVDPADTAKMDEIDARVFCYITEYTYVSSSGKRVLCNPVKIMDDICHEACIVYDEFTRSRDSLKAIRPNSYLSGSLPSWKNGELEFRGFCENQKYCFDTPFRILTEELAELHCIIQAIEYECSQKLIKECRK